MLRYYLSLIDRTPPENREAWHKWNTIAFPVITVDRKIAVGYVWRKRSSDGWTYQRREEGTDPDWSAW